MSPSESTTPPLQPTAPLRWDVFCRVIDNHGDLGVCWRFATHLAGRGQQVRLWVDDAGALAWMAPRGHADVQVRAWADAHGGRANAVAGVGVDLDPGDVVVEAFGCDPPADFVARMAAKAAMLGPAGGAPVWINLEYLSAEEYVERSHGLASPQFSGPGYGLTKWFWYPGFTPRTGGLLREPGLLATLRGSDRQAARADLLRRFDPAGGSGGGSTPTTSRAADVDPTQARLALLFCYDNPALSTWLDAMSRAGRPWRVLVTPGLAKQGVERWWQARKARSSGPSGARGDSSQAGVMRLGSLSLLPLPHVDQHRFDQLLWACDLNFVRGEDSFVRAHWAGRPFIWQAYVQDDGAQHAKIAAWLQVYAGAAPRQLRQALSAAHLAWNGAPGATAEQSDTTLRHLFGNGGDGDKALWSSWNAWAEHRCAELAGQGDLVTQLLDFVAARRLDT